MKFIKVNMSTREVTVEEVPQAYMGLGGRGLTSIMINAEVPPTCDPLGPENKLIFAPGSLSGTSLVNTSRLSVGAKSPLTGTIKESNAGGTVAADLGHLGITAVIFDGQAPEGELYALKIDENGDAELFAADEYRGMRTYALSKKLLNIYGEKNIDSLYWTCRRTETRGCFHSDHGRGRTPLQGRWPRRIGRGHGRQRAQGDYGGPTGKKYRCHSGSRSL